MIIFEQKKLGIFVAFALILVTIAQLFYFHPILPSRIASHFNLMMEPDRWASKNVMMLLHLGVILFFAGLFHFAAWIIGKIPISLINLPEKEYWLSSERKTSTLNALGTFFIWLGNVNLLFINVTFQISYQANLSANKKAHNFWAALLLFLVTIGFMIYHLLHRFRRVARSN